MNLKSRSEAKRIYPIREQLIKVLIHDDTFPPWIRHEIPPITRGLSSILNHQHSIALLGIPIRPPAFKISQRK
jgi:hypothetical protein